MFDSAGEEDESCFQPTVVDEAAVETRHTSSTTTTAIRRGDRPKSVSAAYDTTTTSVSGKIKDRRVTITVQRIRRGDSPIVVTALPALFHLPSPPSSYSSSTTASKSNVTTASEITPALSEHQDEPQSKQSQPRSKSSSSASMIGAMPATTDEPLHAHQAECTGKAVLTQAHDKHGRFEDIRTLSKLRRGILHRSSSDITQIRVRQRVHSDQSPAHIPAHHHLNAAEVATKAQRSTAAASGV